MVFRFESGHYEASTVRVDVGDASAIGEARRRATSLASSQGFDETLRGRVAIVATELARNLVQHAGRGELLFRRLAKRGGVGLEILALDRGPGMANAAQCLHDGYSSGGGTPGTGLGAVMRQSDLFDLHSLPGKGTAIVAQFWSKPPPPTSGEGEFVIGVVSLAKSGEEICGDSWADSLELRRGIFLVADGLGHGPHAAQAAHQARSVFLENAMLDPVEILQRAHAALRPTRGAAAAISLIDRASGQIVFAGVGNISAQVLSPTKHWNLTSSNGTLGHELRKVLAFSYPWPEDGLLVMHSDGLATHWSLAAYPGLQRRHPSVIAGVLYRDFQRGRDDATVLVARCEACRRP